MTSVLAPLQFPAPLANPSQTGLYAVVNWTENPGPTRFLDAGVQVRPINYGGEDAAGIWDEPWCAAPGSGAGSLKTGDRPLLPDPFPPYTVWAYDECDPTPGSQAEVQQRVQQILRLQEPVQVERAFAVRLMDAVTDAGITVNRLDFREAIAYLEGQLAKTGTLGVIHASAEAASLEWGLVLPSGGALRTPLGHQWAFGGGYVDTLGDLVVATSPVYGWRDTVQVRPTLDAKTNTYAAVAERSVVVAYEKLIAAVQTNVEGS